MKLKPSFWKRVLFYAGGTLPAEDAAWVERRLASRTFSLEYFAGSFAILVLIAVPVAYFPSGDPEGFVAIVGIGAVALLVGSLVFGKRFRRHAVERHHKRWASARS